MASIGRRFEASTAIAITHQLHVMDILFKAAKENRDLDRCLSRELHGVKQFANGPLKRYLTRCQTPYGGSVPISEMGVFKNLFGL
jgi:hypothetical protein